MGICKCKRKTDLFCFVHKKAVCEDCICTDHSTCFVKTYVDWLTDSEYETPSCGICKGDLAEGNVVRLMCLDLFHPECLDVHAASLPPHTAKAGYLCPTCSKPVFPPDASSNLAKQLTQHLSNASWAKTIMSGKNPEPVVPSFDLAKKRKQADEASTIGAQDRVASDPSPASLTEIPLNNTSNPGTPNSSNSYASPTTVSLTPVGSSSTQSPNLGRSNSGLNDSNYGIASRKANKEQSIYIDEQDDDDKYKKRSVRELFTAMGFVNKPEKEIKPTKTRQTRIKLDTKRLLIVFALLSCLATVIVMGISLSNDSA